MLDWVPYHRILNARLRAPRHLKDFQRDWFTNFRDAMLDNGEMQGYLFLTSDLWRIAGAHNREYFEKHSSAVLACFSRATMADREVIFFPPLIELIRTQLAKIYRENTHPVHSSDFLQFSLFGNELHPPVAGRGGGRSLSSASGSRFSFDFGSNQRSPENSSPAAAPRRSHGYTQDDFDEKWLRKLAEAMKDCDHVLSMQPGLSERDILELACDRIGLPINRALELKKMQRQKGKVVAAGDKSLALHGSATSPMQSGF